MSQITQENQWFTSIFEIVRFSVDWDAKESAMAIYRVLQNSGLLEPDELDRLGTAYERTLKALGLRDRNDPVTELVAKKLLAIHQTGISDPARLSAIAVEDFAS
jgi:hypothetical protein